MIILLYLTLLFKIRINNKKLKKLTDNLVVIK